MKNNKTYSRDIDLSDIRFLLCEYITKDCYIDDAYVLCHFVEEGLKYGNKESN